MPSHWPLRPPLLALAALLAAAAAATAVPLPKALQLERKAGPGAYSGPATHARVEDIPYIRCQVCELLAAQAWKQGRELLKQGTPGNPIHEDRLIELVENLTTAWRPEGEWIARLDLVEQGERLLVREMEQVGVCGVECRTVERAAEQVMGEHDTDVAEALFVGKMSRAQFSNWLCYELTGACTYKPPPLPKDRAPGPAFQAKRQGSQLGSAELGGLQAAADELRMAQVDGDGAARKPEAASDEL